MKFNINIDKENLIKAGKTAGRIGKAIAVEGTKALLLKGAAKVITTSFEDGIGGVKKLGIDDVIGKPKSEKPKKKKLFSKKQEVAEEVVEAVILDESVEEKLARAKKLMEQE